MTGFARASTGGSGCLSWRARCTCLSSSWLKTNLVVARIFDAHSLSVLWWYSHGSAGHRLLPARSRIPRDRAELYDNDFITFWMYFSSFMGRSRCSCLRESKDFRIPRHLLRREVARHCRVQLSNRRGLLCRGGIANVLPWMIGIPVGISAVIVGVTAVPLAYLLKKSPERSKNITCVELLRLGVFHVRNLDVDPVGYTIN